MPPLQVVISKGVCMSATHKYRKLGGWLLVFVIYYFLQACGVFLQFGEGGLLDILRGWGMYDGAQGWLLMAGQALSLLSVLIYVFTAIEIIRRDPYFLRTRQLALAATALDVIIRLVNGLAYGFTGFDLPMLLGQGLLFLFSLIFVMFYYTRSVRVLTYMGTDEYFELGFFTERVKRPEVAVQDREDKEKTA